MGRYTFRGKGTSVPHELGTAAPPGMAGPSGAAALAGAVDPARGGRTYPLARLQSQMFPSPRAQLG
jgi:hypothetical protein